MLLQIAGSLPFLWLIIFHCVCVCIYQNFFIHSSVDEYLGCFHVLAIVNAAVNMGVQISPQDVISFPSDIYQEVELLDHMMVLFLVFLVVF